MLTSILLSLLVSSFTSAVPLPLPPRQFSESPIASSRNTPSGMIFAPNQNLNSSLSSGESLNFTNIQVPEPIRGNEGSTWLSPEVNNELNRQNPDTLAPPKTDHGDVYQAKWPFSLSHNRLEDGGFARQQNQDVLPAATEMAGVNMRLEPWAYRELHWHLAGEWSYIINGSARISAINEEGQNFIDDVYAGDLWYFPTGRPHSIQALGDGVEFLLVFDTGNFSEDDTFLITDWLAHTPKEVISKNFQLPESSFSTLPTSELYIFPGTPSTSPLSSSSQNISAPNGTINPGYSYHFSKQQPMEIGGKGGTVKIADTRNFPASTTIAAALVTIEPGAMREMHWHPSSDEWNYFIKGEARITIYAAQSDARTFDYQAGDVGYIKQSQGHYIENIGTETVVLLELLKSDKFTDISLGQWISLTPPQVIKDTLKLSDNVTAILTSEEKKENYII